MLKVLTTRILSRSDTSVNWSTVNPILAKGEIGFDTTNGKNKIGDGVTPWNNLQYFVIESDLIKNIVFKADTTQGWAEKITEVSVLNTVYIYTDREIIEHDNKIIKVPGIKIGDGLAYVVDLPFVTVTQIERDFWNNKVRCLLDENDSENLIFTTY